MKSKKSIAAVLTAATIAFSGMGGTFAYASVFADINNLPWSGAAQYIDEAYNLGLMAGYNENGKLYCKAKNNVTYCEATQLMYAIMSKYTGTSVSSTVVSKWTNVMASKNIPSWAYSAVAYGLENSILSQNDISIFMSSATTQNNARREDVAVIFGKALSKIYSLASNPTLSYADKSSVATTSIPYIELLNRLNIMIGDTNNKFNPKVNINRAEMAVLVSKTYSTIKNGQTSSNSSTTSGTVTQYAGKVTAKTSTGSGYTISITSNGKTSSFTATTATTVTNGTSSVALSTLQTGDNIVAVCNGNTATTIIILESGSETVSKTVKGNINTVSETRIAIKTSSGTDKYDINSSATVTIEGSSSTLANLVRKFDGGTNFTATVSLNSNNEAIKIEAVEGSTNDSELDDDAIQSIGSSYIKLANGKKLYLPDDTDDITVKIDSSKSDFDELKNEYKNLDDDEQMIVDDYDLDKNDELETIKVSISEKKTSSSSDAKGIVKAITESKVTLVSGTKYYFADEDDIDKLTFDGDTYKASKLDEFVSDIDSSKKNVYIELTLKSSKIVKAVATSCTSIDDEEIESVTTSSNKIKIDGDTYKYTSSTTVDIVDGNGKITTMAKLEAAIDDDDKTITATVVLDGDDVVISVIGYVSKIGETKVKAFNYSSTVSSCYLTLNNSNKTIKYYFDSGFTKSDLSDINDTYENNEDDGDDTTVTLKLDEEGKITKITI